MLVVVVMSKFTVLLAQCAAATAAVHHEVFHDIALGEVSAVSQTRLAVRRHNEQMQQCRRWVRYRAAATTTAPQHPERP